MGLPKQQWQINSALADAAKFRAEAQEIRTYGLQSSEVRKYTDTMGWVTDRSMAVTTQSESTITPLRPTKALEAHNPAGDAFQCLELITSRDYEAKGASSNKGAVFRNKCTFPVEAIWCVGEESCAAKGYDNLGTMPASRDKGISYDAQKVTQMKVRWRACRSGFAYRPDLKGTLFYACK